MYAEEIRTFQIVSTCLNCINKNSNIIVTIKEGKTIEGKKQNKTDLGLEKSQRDMF